MLVKDERTEGCLSVHCLVTVIITPAESSNQQPGLPAEICNHKHNLLDRHEHWKSTAKQSWCLLFITNLMSKLVVTGPRCHLWSRLLICSDERLRVDTWKLAIATDVVVLASGMIKNDLFFTEHLHDILKKGLQSRELDWAGIQKENSTWRGENYFKTFTICMYRSIMEISNIVLYLSISFFLFMVV